MQATPIFEIRITYVSGMLFTQLFYDLNKAWETFEEKTRNKEEFTAARLLEWVPCDGVYVFSRVFTEK